MERAFPTFVLFLIYILVIVLRAGRRAGSANKKGGTAPTTPTAPTRPTADRPPPTIPAPARRHAKQDDCEYRGVNPQYSHDSQRRVQQLKGYLEAGLIDKNEYAQMLERYTRQDKIYEEYNK